MIVFIALLLVQNVLWVSLRTDAPPVAVWRFFAAGIHAGFFLLLALWWQKNYP